MTIPVLLGYSVQLDGDALRHSREKLEAARFALQNANLGIRSNLIQIRPCKSKEETLAYRCKCSFQIIHENVEDLSGNIRKIYNYAMRSKGKVISIGSFRFPIANICIQEVMERLIISLNEDSSDNPQYELIKPYLTSASFVSSWDEKECVVTLHYCQKLSSSGMFLSQAEKLAVKCRVKHLIARSKGIKIVTSANGFKGEPIIRDVISIEGSRGIIYEKPVEAFQHPNPNVMYEALKWMIEETRTVNDNVKGIKPNLLEMYCGCGAHTIVLNALNLFQKTVAVELDDRLVKSCKNNIELNGVSDIVRVYKGDAGEFAKHALLEKNCNSNNWWEQDSFDVLLVDPPR